MSVFKRFSDIVNSNLNAMLEKTENPQKLLDYIVVEMEDTMAAARTDAVSILTDKKSFQREIKDLEKMQKRWQEKAELAIDKGKDHLAKSALIEKRRCEKRVSHCEQALEELEQVMETLETDLETLQLKLNEALKKQQELSPKKSTQKPASAPIYQGFRSRNRIGETLQKLERFERKLNRLEAEVESYDLGKNHSLQQQIDDLNVDDELEQEFEDLKAKKVSKAS